MQSLRPLHSQRSLRLSRSLLVGWCAAMALAACTPSDPVTFEAGSIQNKQRQSLKSRPKGEGLPGSQTRTVILVSIDGLAPRFLTTQIRAGHAPNFAYLQKHSLFTHNAHTEPDITLTLPNHTSMLTGRPVSRPANESATVAHGLRVNVDTGAAVHDFARPTDYVASVFDEVHDHGGCTGFFAGKDKFMPLARAYGSRFGRADQVGADDGRNKIDELLITADTARLLERFQAALVATSKRCPNGPNFLFFHFRDTDIQGHRHGWGSKEYLNALSYADRAVGEIMTTIQQTPELGDSVVLLTADHGGSGTGHGERSDPDVFQIPFYVWTAGGAAGDLYRRSSGRVEPQAAVPVENRNALPVRNGDAANLTLLLLGQRPIANSYYRGLHVQLQPEEPPRSL